MFNGAWAFNGAAAERHSTAESTAARPHPPGRAQLTRQDNTDGNEIAINARVNSSTEAIRQVVVAVACGEEKVRCEGDLYDATVGNEPLFDPGRDRIIR